MTELKVPEMRFEGYDGEWEETKLGDVVTVNYGKDYQALNRGDIPVYGTGGIITYVSDYLSAKDSIGLGRKGTINNPFILKHPFWTVDTLFFIENSIKVDLQFLYSVFLNIDWTRLNEASGVPSLSKSNIEKVRIKVPTKAEQEKIGSLFAQLDKVIELQENLIEENKTFKKSMLQKMFPKEGEFVPEIRFAGFEDEWEFIQLDEIVDIIGGGTPKTSVKEYWDGNINWFTPSEIKEAPYVYESERKITREGLEKSSAKIMPKDKTILFTSRATIGEMAILKEDSTTNQGFQSLVVKDTEETNVYFLYSLKHKFKRYGKKQSFGSTFNEVPAREMKKMTIQVPKIEEQEKIGSFFQTLDSKIQKEEKKLEIYKTLKKALLEKMFI